jgi:hypothetical protein
MATELNTPNVEIIIEALKKRGMTARQLSKLIYGEDTHRDIVKEITKKPDVRASTVVKLCRALGITMDSLYQNRNTNNGEILVVEGSNENTKPSDDETDSAVLMAENRALKLVIEEKDKRISDLVTVKEQLDRRLDLLLELQKGAK